MINERAVLNLTPVADHHLKVDVRILADDALAPDARPLAHLCVDPDLGSRSNLRTRRDHGRGMNVCFCHRETSAILFVRRPDNRRTRLYRGRNAIAVTML